MVGAWLAYAVRFSEVVSSQIPFTTALPPLGWYIKLSLVLAGFVIVIMIAGRLYRFPSQLGLFEDLQSSLKRYFSAYTLTLAGLFFYRGVSFSRATMALLFILCAFGLVVSRGAGRWFRQVFYRSGVALRRTALIGRSEQASRIAQYLESHPEFGFTLLGLIDGDSSSSDDLKVLGRLENVQDIIHREQLETLIIAPAKDEPDPVPDLIKSCYGINVDFLYLPDINAGGGRPRQMVKVGGVPLWALKDVPFSGWHGLLKRSFDVITASIMGLMLSPLMIIIAIIIKLDSRGPLIYRQRRIGLDGLEFDCLKFRSMRPDAEESTGAIWAKADDPRRTRIGSFLRRWSIDELPQLWNVIRGDMSMVGPRPERPVFVKQFEKEIDGYQERHRVRVGITGWAQVNGLRGDTPISDRTVYDRFYVENWSLLFDLKIMLFTLTAIVKGENSY